MMDEMLPHHDRSRLSLPVSNTGYDTGVVDEMNVGELQKSQKLLKSLSVPTDHSTRSPPVEVPCYSSSSSHSSKDSRSHPVLSCDQRLFTGFGIRDAISNTTAKFFGVPPSDERQFPATGTTLDPKWNSRRMRYIYKRYGNLKSSSIIRELRPQPLSFDDFFDALLSSKNGSTHEATYDGSSFIAPERGEKISRSRSVESQRSFYHQRLERRDSVMKMAFDKLSTLVQRGTFRPKKASGVIKRGRSTSSSFSPFSIQQNGNVTRIKIGAVPALNNSVLNAKRMSTVNEGNYEISCTTDANLENTSSKLKKLKREEDRVSGSQENRPGIHFRSDVEIHPANVCLVRFENDISPSEPLAHFNVTVNNVLGVTAKELESLKEKDFLPLSLASTKFLQDEVFFDVTPPTYVNASNSARSIQRAFETRQCKLPSEPEKFASPSIDVGVGQKGRLEGGLEEAENMVHNQRAESKADGLMVPGNMISSEAEEKFITFTSLRDGVSYSKARLLQSFHITGEKKEEDVVEIRLKRRQSFLNMLQKRLKSEKYYIPYRRRMGLGFGIWKKIIPRSYKNDACHLNKDTYVDYRPFFTYWVTTVQTLIALISLYTYGLGPWGFGRSEMTADVLHTTVTLKRVHIYVQQNVWIGPKFAALVHLGAKFTPCMRKDPRIYAQIEADRKEENRTGCCIYNDGTGCFQTGQSTCPSLIAKLERWKEDGPSSSERVSGAVCGQDPRYCEDPVSVKPYEWPDDITQWPICKHSAPFIPENEKHMHCEITGRPCCIQLHGRCRITTRDYCDFVEGGHKKGYGPFLCFHAEDIFVKVSCLNEICGMLPFLRRNHPDQWYRFFIPLFLHAGIFHCMLTVIIQMLYMRDLEKLLGWARIAILYMVSGIGGNLAGAIFVPYKPEVGPAGSHVGMFAAMYVDVVYNWNLLKRPWHAVVQLSLFMLALFAIGTLPWIDNWAHLFGFVFGFLISLSVLPYIQTKQHNRTWRLLIIIASLLAVLGLFIILLTLFYWLPGFDCPYCEYFNCIPYTDHFCDNQGLRLKNWLPI